jgi:sugar phosphate isomerase/epimerase
MAISQLATQLYTLRDFLTTPEDIDETFRKVREIGYEAVQVSGIKNMDATVVKTALDKYELFACGSHMSLDDLKNNTQKCIDDLAIMECEDVSVPFVGEEYRNADGYKRLAGEMNEIATKLKEANVQLTYHNHAFEFEKYDGVTGLEIIYDESDPELVFAEIDTYWVQAGGGDPADTLRWLAGRIPLLHLKDMAIVNNEAKFMAIGEGNMNFDAIIKAAKEGGTQWYIIEQDTCPRDPFDCLKVSFEACKRLGID